MNGLLRREVQRARLYRECLAGTHTPRGRRSLHITGGKSYSFIRCAHCGVLIDPKPAAA